MYIAPVDNTLSEEEWRPFVVAQGFGHLVASGRNRDLPVVVPTQFVLEGDEILMHLVARNPMLEAIAENPRVLMSVAGDWAFIPSAWKAIGDEDPLLGIPTTYYAAAQLAGTATISESTEGTAEILRRQLSSIQPDFEVADPEVHAKRIASIRGVRIAVDEVRAKFKYGGNVDVEHREAVVEHLRERMGPGDSAAAAHTLRRIQALQS
ncbi:MAG: FMN-binding negative transcriptional regulator [Acidimicrobiales bacterium]|jgi:transcriptional regulator